jgi:hypothetical protein
VQETNVRISGVLKSGAILLLAWVACAAAQQEKKPEAAPGQPQVKLNYLNVCAPSAEDQAEIKAAFAKVIAKPAFSRDYEISRGRATVENAPESRFVRLRRDFAADSPLLTAQYSLSVDAQNTVETLVLRMRDPKQFHEIALEDRVSTGVVEPSALLTIQTPVSHIQLERFTKGSIVLARCPSANQSAYDPLFRQATDIMSQYRTALGLRDAAFRSDIHWLNAEQASKKPSPASSKPETK